MNKLVNLLLNPETKAINIQLMMKTMKLNKDWTPDPANWTKHELLIFTELKQLDS